MVTTILTKQSAVLDRWIPTLQQLPAVEIIWLEGSLATNRANPGSDIDIRFGIADSAYQQLWETDRRPLLAGLGEYLLLQNTFVRALTADGLIVEAWAHKTSELNTLALYEWKILFNRMPVGEPTFHKLPELSPAETWSDDEPLTPELVQRKTYFLLQLMATTTAPFYSDERHSARFQLDDMRTELVKLMYRRIGIYFAKRYKHFSEILPREWLNDLARTHTCANADPFDVTAMAAAYVEMFAVFGQHLQALSDQAGGGFEPKWYWRLYEQVANELKQLPVTDEYGQ
ncbi:MAG: nucleotidyltransferase domain-containing protein [Chloroflexi bacterium]|nr:nucleotidyltransferase domain-containing protein [Chloroflexota bacterium]